MNTIKKYFDLHKAINKESQFNKKVNLNIQMHEYRKENNINLIDISGVYFKVMQLENLIGEIYPIKCNKSGAIKSYKYKVK
jgi:hypothetical protein